MPELNGSSSVGSEQQWATFTRWFHGHNIAWRGTPSELLSQLAKNGEQNRPFTDAGELLQFIAQNTEALRQAGIQAAVERPAGRPTRVCLESVATGNGQGRKLAPSSLENTSVEAPAATDSRRPQERVEPVSKPPAASSTIKRLPVDIRKRGSVDRRRRRRRLIAVICIVAALVIIGLAIVMIHRGHGFLGAFKAQPPNTASSVTPSGGNADQAADVSKNDPRDLALEELIRDAGVSKSPSAEEELATRYMEGRGAQRDIPAAYTWLVLARANGSNRDDELIRKLGSQLSPQELQKVRVYLGNSYARGIGVTRDLVMAHSWFELAEAAGSKDATTMRRSLEESMTPEQIQRARARTAEWLARRRTAPKP